MNKIIKIMLSILGGIEITLTIFTPIILATLWINISGFNLGSYFIYGIGFLSTLFRAIKIGWMKK